MAGGSAVVISVSGGNLPHFGLDQESAIKMKKLLDLTRAVVLTGVILDNYP